MGTMTDETFADLLDRHAGLIRRVASVYCRDAAAREDVVQEIALQAWRSRHRYDGRCKESTWLYRIAVNVAISHHRRERRQPERGVPLDEQAIAAPEAEAGIWKRIDALIAEHRKRRRLAEEAAHVPPGR